MGVYKRLFCHECGGRVAGGAYPHCVDCKAFYTFEEKVKLCNGSPAIAKTKYSTPCGYSVSEVCDCRGQPRDCLLSREEYSKLPTKNLDDIPEGILKGGN